MPPDYYKVEVLHLLNPHLIWVEVRDSGITSNDEHGIKFEQIGIYGVLPLETCIDLEDEEITVQGCNEWLPASATLMRKFLGDDGDIMFNPLFLDRRSSIFNDNIHKFGDLLVKKRNGKTKSLSTLLRTSGFATYDEGLFHAYLSQGKIITKLNRVETQKVLTELENYFVNKNVAKKKSEKQISKHTSVARVSCDLEEALFKPNVDHNNKNMKAYLESKYRDLELCKGVDEPSLGRATTRKDKEKKILTPVEKKLQLLHEYKYNADKYSNTNKNQTSDHAQAFEDTKMYLETHATPYTKKISSKTDAHKAQILKKVMCKTAIKKVSKHERSVKLPDITSDKLETLKTESLSSSHKLESHDSIPKIDKIIPLLKTDLSCQAVTSQQDLNESKTTDASSSSVSKKEKSPTLDKTYTYKTDKAEATSLKEDLKDASSNDKTQQDSYNKNKTHHSLLKDDQKSWIKDSKEDKIRNSLKSKATKSAAKTETSSSTEPDVQSHGDNNSVPLSILPQQRLKNPLKSHQDRDSGSSRRAATSKDSASRRNSESQADSNLNQASSKNSGNENASRKSKRRTNSNYLDPVKLIECHQQLRDGIKKLEFSRNLAKLNIELPISETFTKTRVKRRGKKHSVIRNVSTKAIFGPPGIDFNAITRVPPVLLYGGEGSNSDEQNPEVKSNRHESNVDRNSKSGPSYKTNKGTEKEPAKKKIRMQESDPKRKGNEPNDVSSSSSSVWERRLKLHKKIARNKRASLTSDTTNKDSSNVEENSPSTSFGKENAEEDSDESITDIIEKLTLKTQKNVKPHNKIDKSESFYQPASVKANPFQNFDINNSVFVDNLVTPIMMVHSKMNKRFVPTCNFRDIHFSEHTRLVLKNLGVSRPMMIQSITWNAILKGYSVFMIGSPACGKTIGFLPAVCNLVTDYNQSESYCDSVGPYCIIVCATSQSVSEIERLAKMLVGFNERVVSCYYGHDELAIATSLLNGCELLICTAPSLVRLLRMSDFGVDLQRLATFVFEDCERLSEVYLTEIKFCLYKIKEMQKSRVNKELLVQYVVASRVWCDFFESFAKKAPDTVVCIGAFQECVLYAKANMTVKYVKKINKLNNLMEFLEDIDSSKRSVVVCDTDEEVDYLSRALQTSKYFIFAANSKMNVQNLYNLNLLWKEFSEPFMAPVLICCDINLYHLNVANANYLAQYSMPSLYSGFCKRFATLNECYPSIFKKDNQDIKILVLLEEHNVEQFPKIINYVKRCTNNVPEFLDDICINVLADKDARKAENCAPLCNSLLTLGECPDLYNCKSRHTILKNYDTPKEWMPKSGLVTFKILHYQSAALYSARLIGNIDSGLNKKYPPSYSSMSLKMGLHYSNVKNRIPFGIPKLGDICAVAYKCDSFSRCQVIKIIDKDERGNSNNILVNLLDEEIIEITSDTNLYHLPDDFKTKDTYVVHIRLANIQPRDRDVVFSELARDQVMKATYDLKKGMYMRGKVVLTVANCIFVDTLEVCQELKSLNETVVTYNVKRELLEKHAEVNPNHITKIETLCQRAGLKTQSVENETNAISVDMASKMNWVQLDDDICLVELGTVESPAAFFVKLTKYDDGIKTLIKDIQKYVDNTAAKVDELEPFEIVLAEYPDDGMYERARIDEIGDDKVKCFFVDQGEWRDIDKDKFIPISEELITQLPFQAIECRLFGIKPEGDQWTDFSTNWLFDNCSETESGAIKQLYVKYYTQEPGQFTGGYKYGVVIIDTYGSEDVIVNELMINLNLAKEFDEEIKVVNFFKRKSEPEVICEEVEDCDASWENLTNYSINFDPTKKPPDMFSSIPIRSVPLVGSDDDTDDFERWNINMSDDMAKMFRLMIGDSTQGTASNLPAIEGNVTEIVEEIDIDSLSKNIEECTRQFEKVKVNLDSSKDLDSDDLSSPEACQSAETSNRTAELVEDPQLRKPKLHWRQTKTSVMIKIQLIGVEKYELKLRDRALSFAASVNDTNYGFDFELYGVVDKKTANHCDKGQYILVKFDKVMHKNWLTLTKDGEIRKWIVYDLDSIDVSSDEEQVRDDNLHNIVRGIHDSVDSESDDGCVDDVSGRKNDD